MSRWVFGETPPPPLTGRYQDKQKHMLAAGIHPATREALRTDGTTCGGCIHLRGRQFANTYWKCRLAVKNTGGPASDVRKRWPACMLYRPEEPA